MPTSKRPANFPADPTAPMSAGARQRWLDEIHATLDDPQYADIEELKTRLRQQLDAAREAWSQLADSTSSLASEAADCADEFVHARPWQAVGVAAGVGMLVGALLCRR